MNDFVESSLTEIMHVSSRGEMQRCCFWHYKSLLLRWETRSAV